MGCAHSTPAAPRKAEAQEPRGVPVSVQAADRPAVALLSSDYELAALLGQGSFGRVYGVRSKTSPVPLAVKVIEWAGARSMDDWAEQVAQEATVWKAVSLQLSQVGCKEVLLLQQHFSGESCCAFITERLSATLWQHLRQQSSVDEGTISPLLAQMTRGVSQVHRCKVVHRDIKNANFMLQGHVVKLIDFGLAAFCSRPLTVVVGTAPFMSPEMLGTRGYDAGTDVWSLGVVAHTLLCGSFPYMPQQLSGLAMKEAIRAGVQLPLLFPDLSEHAGGFLRCLLARQPDQRPTSEDALKFRYVREPAQYGSGQSLVPKLLNAYACGAF